MPIKPSPPERPGYHSRILLACMLFAGSLLHADDIILERVDSEAQAFRVVRVVGGLEHPWAIEFLPDHSLLITERPGRLQHFKDGKLTPIQGLPEITAQGQGGLLDVIKHPDFTANQLIYFSYAAAYDDGLGTVVARARLNDNQLEDVEVIFRMTPTRPGGPHYGSRLAFDADTHLFITIGDRGDRKRAQELDSHNGSLIRLHDDGRVPANNPFVDRADALPEIYSYGHRNAQGLVIDPDTGHIWQHEHGPRGGDTLNLIRAGANYGWPVATHGKEYRDGSPIGDLPEDRDDIEDPVRVWAPVSIAPSGMILYRGNTFPGWNGNLFIGALRQQHISRVVLDGTRATHEEVLLRDEVGRIRDLEVGPDGYIWFATDARDGGVFRIEPL